MSGTSQTATLLGLITQQLNEISGAVKEDDSKVITRLIQVTEQLHGLQVHIELAGMHPLTHPNPGPGLAERDIADPTKKVWIAYPAQESEQWQEMVNSLRAVIGRDPETHEVKACFREQRPVFAVGQPVRYSGCDKSVDGQAATITGIKLPLEMDCWMYQTSFDRTRWHPAGHLADRTNPA